MRLLVVLGILSLFVALAVVSDASSEKSPKRRNINLPGRTDDLPFSHAVQLGNTLYISGRIGQEEETGKVPANVDAEIKLLLDGLKDTLAAGGMTMDDLVYVQVFCPDLSLYGKFNAAYRRYFTKGFPARAFIGSGPLLFGAHFELQAIAVKP